jgi:hypothetical protein
MLATESVSVSAAVYEVVAIGVNLTIVLHDAATASVPAQVVEKIVKRAASVPVIDRLTLSVVVPTFVSMRVVLFVGMLTVPNAKLVGEKEATGAAPVNVTV